MKTIILFIGVCASFISYAQILSVVDKDTKKGIEALTLTSENPKYFAVTNPKGQVNVDPFKNSDKIIFQMLGYETVVKSYTELESTGFKLEIKTTAINLDNVVISPTKFVQSSDLTPNKVSSISAKKEELYNPQTAADLLQTSGNVYIQKSQQGGGSPMIRGFATNRLLYSIDGVRMNTAIFRGGNIQNVINIDPFAVNSTEVLFGPGSVIYGSDAIGGVMSFNTLTPTLSLNDSVFVSGKAVTRFSTVNNERTGHFDINLGWKKWAMVTSVSTWDYDHLRQGSNGPSDYIKPYYVSMIDSNDVVISQEDSLLQIPSAYSQKNIMQKLRYTPNANWDFQYGFHYSETSPYGRYDRHNRIKNNLPRYGEWSYGPQKWMMHNLGITNTNRNLFYDQFILRVANQSFEESRISRNFNNDSKEIRVEDVIANSVNWDFVKSLGNDNTTFYGIEYVSNDVTSTGTDIDISTGESAKGASRYPNSTWQSIAFYINNEHDFGDKFILQTGARVNNYALDAVFDTTFFPLSFDHANFSNTSLTGSIGAVYRPNKYWAIRMNTGTAFRSPNVDDIGKIFDSELGAVTVPNPNLEAEYAYNVDLGIAKVIADKIKLDLTGYYTILDNALVRRDYSLDGNDSIIYAGEMSKVQAIQNAATAYVYGIQAGVDIQLPKGFSFNSNFNYQKGEEELDDGSVSNSRHAAPIFGNVNFNYRFEKLSFSLYSFYQGEVRAEDFPVGEQGKDEIYAKDSEGNNYSPSWYTLNYKMNFQLNQNISIGGGIENITDQRYRPFSSGISGAGRNFTASLRIKF